MRWLEGRRRREEKAAVALLVVAAAATVVWRRGIWEDEVGGRRTRAGVEERAENGWWCGGGGPPERAYRVSVEEYGGVGDGRTLNTAAFQRALEGLSSDLMMKKKGGGGGAVLEVPAGRWLTGCITLPSHVTLFLHSDAFLLATPDPKQWPLVDPLPSYGRGRERPGMRHCSLIHAHNVTDVWITGNNGTIDGQGWIWWDMWRNRSLEHTRGHLIEFVGSTDVGISNIVLRNSPFWTVHPVYCNNVIVKNVTILAPWDAPNTDGIDPDSSSNVCIEDCYISNGDDLVAIKSGWDQYGMRVARPSINITIRRVTGTSRTCSGIAFGSEVSGGIANVHVEDVHIFNSSFGIRLKTAPGRGGFITNITISNVTLTNVKHAIDFTGDSGEHPTPLPPAFPSNFTSPSFFSLVSNISITNVIGSHIQSPGRFVSIPDSPFHDICLYNISLHDVASPTWLCSHAIGSSFLVSPQICTQFTENSSHSILCK